MRGRRFLIRKLGDSMPVFFRNKRIALYIRTGLTRIKESRRNWFFYGSEGFMGCALGLAIAGKLGTNVGHKTFLDGLIANGNDEVKTICKILEIQPLLFDNINALHLEGVTAIQIAEALEFEDGEDELNDFQ